MVAGESFARKRVLVTGGLGFIGSNLSRRLVEYGAEVTLVDSLIPEYGGNLFNIQPIREHVRVNFSDVRDEHSMKYLVQNKDYLFNLAGQTSHLDSMNDPYTDLEINTRAQLSILESCRRNNPDIKIVFASTRQIYGKPRYLPVDENHPLSPVDVNGINKMAGEWYHLVYNNVYRIRATVLRLTNTYGPRMRIKDARQTFLGIWIRRVIEGEPFLVYGDGLQKRDFNYVDDVTDALLAAAESEKANGEIYNLGADDPVSLKETAEMMIDILGKGFYQIIPFPPERKIIDIGDYYGSYEKISRHLGWKPETGLREGLRKTIEYYQEFIHHYVEP
ncbi:MAG: NAD-dependent epimerase/dehydratase family protein [Desulfomonilia bacterium]|nr:NAD-dependent epimerase/dehydratase family protein [Deltaproteobacteria bacterium]